jgi:hypothetical protein
VEHDLARVRGTMLEEQPLRAGKLDEVTVAGHDPALEIDLDVIEPDDARARRCPGAPAQDGAHACGKPVRAEGLGDAVVGAEVETGW